MYKFRCELKGHTSDVRCIVNYDEDVIISGSRDMISRVWVANDGKFVTGPILCGHTDYISSICVVPPSDLYPEGLIVTGSNDCSICAYTPNCADIQFKLTSHTGTVCCVNAAPHEKYGLLSSSWDFTVIMWDICTKSVVFKIPGNIAVWSVIQMECGTIITASADKIIRSYTRTGDLITSYYGHRDCVRCLYPINKTEFVSCGNDGYVLRWVTGDSKSVTAVDSIHHFLYSICYLPSQNMYVYCGERGVIYVNSGNVSEVINLPCSTVWGVTILPDGDIAAGCNDGVIRVFTSDPKRYADDLKMMQYNKDVEKCTREAIKEKNKALNLPYLNDLSGSVVLDSEGKISSELIFVRRGFFAVMYSWSTDRWVELAKRNGTYQYDISTKKIHEGKAYDYIFPINIDDSKPNLILPITLGDNLLEKIYQFISQHNLASHYCDTIYTHVANSIKDDFLEASNLESRELIGDIKCVNYFPRSEYVCFEKGNIDQIIAKLFELASSNNLNISEDKTAILNQVTNPNYDCSSEDSEFLLSLLDMPKEVMFPIFDFLRLALKNQSFHNLVLSNSTTVNKILQTLKKHLDSSPVNKLMILKVYCNMFNGYAGRIVVKEEFEYLTDALAKLQFPSNFSPSLQISACSLLLNLIILAEKIPHLHPLCLECAISLIDKILDKEALFRLFIGIGNLISYAGSFFIPNILVEKLKKLCNEKACLLSSANDCLETLLKCFQND